MTTVLIVANILALTTLLLLTAAISVSDFDLTFLITAEWWLCWTGHMTAGDLQSVLLTYALLTAFYPCCIGLRTECLMQNYDRRRGIIRYYWLLDSSGKGKKGLAL